MKKIISLVLSLALVFCFCGCKEKESDAPAIDINYYLNLGQIPEASFVLGDLNTDIYDALTEEQAEAEIDGENYYLNEVVTQKTGYVTNGSFEYYYKTASTEDGVGYIVSYTDAYGLKLGAVISEVKEALKGNDFTEEKASYENAFFYVGNIDDTVILKITGEKNSVSFLFESNALCATAIYRNDWN